MEDKSVMKLSLIVSAIGFILLLITLSFVQPQQIAIKDISSGMVGSYVEVTGAVESISAKTGDIFITLNDSSTIDIIVFSRTAKDFPLVYDTKKGDNLTVAGKVSLYKSRLELAASSLKF